MKKKFLITIDTEGDNIWQWKYGDPISTENSKYLQRFQFLAEKYNFKPVYLTDYEMAMDNHFQKMALRALSNKTCEIGMHLHAVNNPPFYNLDVAYPTNFPYLIEYPNEIMEKKIDELSSILESRFDDSVISHRAGRWALNESYISLLTSKGYKVDCSVTPGIDWRGYKGCSLNSMGSDYSDYPSRSFYLNDDLLELPVTIRKLHKSFANCNSFYNTARYLKHTICGQKIWLRPNGNNLKEILYLLEKEKYEDSDYLMFMLHSSELMPGGCPWIKTNEDVEALYKSITEIFESASSFCVGMTIKEYIGV